MGDFDVETVRSLVGDGALMRGRAYARQGAVLSVSVDQSHQQTRITAQVRGTGSAPYAVRITSWRAPAGPGLTSACSCPVGQDCKHVAAVLLVVAESDTTGLAAWEIAMRAVATEAMQTAELLSLGIQFSFSPSSGRPSRLGIVPVMNEHGRWTQRGVTWAGPQYHRAFDTVAPESALELFREIAALGDAGAGYGYYASANVAYLDSFRSRRIWDVLAGAASAEVALLGPGRDALPVNLSRAPAQVTVDISESAGAWELAPTITVQGEPVPADSSMLLGAPAHGIAWWESDDRETPTGRVNLAPLERALAGRMRSIFEGGRPLEIPAAERDRFLRNYFPALRSQIALVSSDGSADIPVPAPPRLAVTAELAAVDKLIVRIDWSYPLGDTDHRLPLQGPGLRDRDAELAALQEFLKVPGVVPLLAERSSSEAGNPVLASESQLAGSEVVRFHRDVLPLIEALGTVQVSIEGDSPDFREAESAPVISFAGSADTSDWFDLSVTVTVDGEPVPFQELFTALATGQDYLILNSGAYFALDLPEFDRLRELIAEARGLIDEYGAVLRVSRFQADFWSELQELGVLGAQARAWSEQVRRLAETDAIEDRQPPVGLKATLRPYQQSGFNWLAFLYEHRLGGVLADDMGLGKTIQALALIALARQQDPTSPPFLVVAPTSVVGNWASECAKFVPHLRVVAISETQVRRGLSLSELAADADIVVTSYALFRIEFEQYSEIAWAGLLLDEAQFIKNHQSKGYQCAKKLRAPFKVVITGTPMENNLSELWAMFSLAAPGLFGDPKHFGEYYRQPIEKSGNAERMAQLRSRIRPLMLRRTKEQVADDLPEKLEQVMELDLSPRHRKVYQTYLQRERQKVLGLLGDLGKNRFEIFRSLTLLRQASLDVSLLDAKHHAVPSTKLDALMELLDDVVAEGHRVLVFSQFTRFLGGVRNRLQDEGIDYCYLDGATRNRPEVLRQFKSGTAPVFLISLKAGGVGLNLTEADYCILLDPWWNPATEAQAVDRVHRIGQTKKVMVYRLVAKDTIEEKVMALKAKKAALFSSVMDDGGIGSNELTAADIRSLLE